MSGRRGQKAVVVWFFWPLCLPVSGEAAATTQAGGMKASHALCSQRAHWQKSSSPRRFPLPGQPGGEPTALVPRALRQCPRWDTQQHPFSTSRFVSPRSPSRSVPWAGSSRGTSRQPGQASVHLPQGHAQGYAHWLVPPQPAGLRALLGQPYNQLSAQLPTGQP